MDRPDAERVREITRTDWATLGYAEGDPDPLDVIVATAAAYVEEVTGRPLDETMPDALAPLAERAVAMRAEQEALWTQPGYVEDAADDLVQSFSAGSYSETRRQASSQQAAGLPQVNVWRALNDLLWLLMTPEKRDEWRDAAQGRVTPAFEVTEVDWQESGLLDFPWEHYSSWPGWGY